MVESGATLRRGLGQSPISRRQQVGQRLTNCAVSAKGSRQGRDFQTVLYQPKAEGIAGTYKLYHISRKHLCALSEINFYSETVKFSFFDFCFGFAETGFCCNPSASLFGALPQSPLAAPRQTRPRLRLGSKDAFPERDFWRDFGEGALPPNPPQSPFGKGVLTP